MLPGDFMGKMKAKLIVIQASSTTWSGGGGSLYEFNGWKANSLSHN